MDSEQIRAVVEVLSEAGSAGAEGHAYEGSSSEYCTSEGTDISDKQKDPKFEQVNKDGITVGKYKCQICGESFALKIDMHVHRISHSVMKENNGSEQEDQATSETGICDIDSQISWMRSAMNQNAEFINSLTEYTKTYTCKICKMKFPNLKMYQEHKSIHPKSKLSKCERCGKTFAAAGNLRRHELIHVNLRPFKCDICHKTFSQKAHLEAHHHVHSKEKPYICVQCGTSFTRHGNLKRHEMIHRNERKYSCMLCRRVFNQPGQLKAHSLTHIDERPFECGECGKTFTRKGNLKRHIQLHEYQHRDPTIK